MGTPGRNPRLQTGRQHAWGSVSKHAAHFHLLQFQLQGWLPGREGSCHGLPHTQHTAKMRSLAPNPLQLSRSRRAQPLPQPPLPMPSPPLALLRPNSRAALGSHNTASQACDPLPSPGQQFLSLHVSARASLISSYKNSRSSCCPGARSCASRSGCRPGCLVSGAQSWVPIRGYLVLC